MKIDKKTKTVFAVSIIALIGVGIGFAIWNANQPNVAEPISGFGSVLDRVRKQHPAIYAWYNGLTTTQQNQIEKGMTPAMIQYMYREMQKKELSADVKDRLRRAGYQIA